MDIEISVTHSMELSEIHRKKYEKLVKKFHAGLMTLPGVDSVVGPVLAEIKEEIEKRERIKQESKIWEKNRIEKSLMKVLREPEYVDLIRSRVRANPPVHGPAGA